MSIEFNTFNNLFGNVFPHDNSEPNFSGFSCKAVLIPMIRYLPSPRTKVLDQFRFLSKSIHDRVQLKK